MVKLGFTIWTKGSLNAVFEYFSKFEKISQWDLNVKASKKLKQTHSKIGSTFQVTSVFKQKESILVYLLEQYKQNQKIYLTASNNIITATDELLFTQKNGGTQITYNADISLRHVFWLLTPFMKGDFQELAQNAKKGMELKCKQIFG